ncbi:MAG TPA: cupin domain-containing protein [Ktedonobacteraceae bacterium]|jgi:uncharacterized cupin superfamily protein
MQIIRKADAKFVDKQNGTQIHYYLFPEYELDYNEIAPHTTQDWHAHNTIEEAIYVISGELTGEWIEGSEKHQDRLYAGDLVRSEASLHTFSNESDAITKFIVIKLVLDGKNKRDIFKTDKVTMEGAENWTDQ